ncbi:polysaccharide deacetylase family protein [Candidatus Erwinia haradaeae]|uniref:Glycoside hydrolase/deacetylase, beta/alpha-barrel superfamily protein n=1 Tax=Candidatus Erwinia haradaeae TaxID=1922217 RepID=A0A451D803_9GAMM|nr:deacetylase [Candidatus Erwinia haradaeae]VFP81903.1 Glycoside hydrolase/deacetylase, beta/alpha-barrel superfamily protein [Candidatus Erwinia haradaeae]
MNLPALLITVDTEGDNLWNNHDQIMTKNTYFLPRFQQLCEKYQFKPTWLTNYEMIINPEYIEFSRNIIRQNTGEIGMHLHACNNPPLYDLTGDDKQHQPYLIEYPEQIIRDKIIYITGLLEDTLQIKMRSHRAGRWAFNIKYAQILIEQGYQVDCSVTPRVNWKQTIGDPKGEGGTDYNMFPDYSYFIDEKNISKPGSTSLLEVPMSIQYKHSNLINQLQIIYHYLRGKKHNPTVHWLRPSGGNVKQMIDVVKTSLRNGRDYVEFMIHSSELMPGGSPAFKTAYDIEVLYNDLEQLFIWLHPYIVSMTLSEFYSEKITYSKTK